jgi:hypothetical protein
VCLKKVLTWKWGFVERWHDLWKKMNQASAVFDIKSMKWDLIFGEQLLMCTIVLWQECSLLLVVSSYKCSGLLTKGVGKFENFKAILSIYSFSSMVVSLEPYTHEYQESTAVLFFG